MRGAALLLLAFACDQPPVGSAWTEVEVAEAAGIWFEDVSVIGDRAVAVGSRDAARGAALVIDGEAWTAIDTSDLPPLDHVFAAAPDDVWAAAEDDPEGAIAPLWRWDGTGWSPVELADGILGVRDVWGTGPDDVWIAAQFEGPAADGARAYHWDGSAMTEHRDFFEMLGEEDDGTTSLSMKAGCSRSPDDVWLASLFTDTLLESSYGWAYHFDGAEWRVHAIGNPRDLECLETETWYLAGAVEFSGPSVGRWQRGLWLGPIQFEVKDETYARLASLHAAAGSLWVVGDEVEIGEAESAQAQAWRLVDGVLVRTLDRPAIPPTPDGRPLLRALYETPAGAVRALGAHGLVLDHAGDP
jgi:hypothetical protein